MTSSGRVYFSPLIILCFVVVNSAVINAGKVSSGGDVVCPFDGERIQAQYHENGHGIFRIKVCACGGVVDLGGVVVLAESEELCHSSGVHLVEWDRNESTTIDRRCLITKPLHFHALHGYQPGKMSVLCPFEQSLWNKSIPLQLPYMYVNQLPMSYCRVSDYYLDATINKELFFFFNFQVGF